VIDKIHQTTHRDFQGFIGVAFVLGVLNQIPFEICQGDSTLTLRDARQSSGQNRVATKAASAAAAGRITVTGFSDEMSSEQTVADLLKRGTD